MDIASQIPSLEAVVTGLAAGTLTYPATIAVFHYLARYGYLAGLGKAAKRWIVLGIAFGLAGLGLAGTHAYLGQPVTLEDVWVAGFAAFWASQQVHGHMAKSGKSKGSPTSLD